MKKVRHLIITGLVVVASLTLWQCHHHKKTEPQPDACAGKTATGAKFNIYENIKLSYPGNSANNYWIKYSTDTVHMRVIDFVAEDINAVSYEWKIGDTTYSTKSVSVDVSTRPANLKQMPITLTVKKGPANSCFPSDTGTITSTQLLVFWDSTLVSGNFRGIKTNTDGSNPSDSFTVFIDPRHYFIVQTSFNTPDTTGQGVYAYNLYPNCGNDAPYDESIVSYKELVFSTWANNCNNLGGQALIGPTVDDITIWYAYVNPSTNKIENYIFKGHRLK